MRCCASYGVPKIVPLISDILKNPICSGISKIELLWDET